jgi:hypothetical protein
MDAPILDLTFRARCQYEDSYRPRIGVAHIQIAHVKYKEFNGDRCEGRRLA